MLRLSYNKENGAPIKSIHDFDKSKDHPSSIITIQDFSITNSNINEISKLHLNEIFQEAKINISISDSFELCSNLLVQNINSNEYVEVTDEEVIFGELDFYNETLEMNFWWIIKNSNKFSNITASIIKSSATNVDIHISGDFLHEIRRNSNFILYPERITFNNSY
jgi:hypothetical protein